MLTGRWHFFEVFLRHSKGAWAGAPFRLQAWQADQIIRPLFGWLRPDGTRRYRTAYIEMSRKNGKSTLASGIALYLLFADGEPGAEVFSAAADREQAAIVFNQARAMVEESPALLRKARLFKHSITVPAARSVYRVLSAEAYTKHGLNAHGIVFDELHAQPNRELYDVLNTSTGARRQPLMVMITTAGWDRNSICYEMHQLTRAVLADPNAAPAHFGYIAAAGDGDDWTDPRVWAAANPGMGQTVSAEYLADQCQQALMTPGYQNTFRRLHLNQWTSQESRWLDMATWDACGMPLPELAGRTAYAGLDLASTTDLAALVLVFPPRSDGEPFWFLPRFWIPEQGLVERVRRDRVPYDTWLRQGLVTATPGNVIDYAFIEAEIGSLRQRFDVRECAFDRWGATQISQRLGEAGLTMVEFGQGFASMSAPTKELNRLLLAKQVGHGGNAVLRWMADGVAVRQDPAGNIKPDKAKSTTRIDGIVAAVMGLDRAIRNQGKQSVYEDRGIRVL